MWDENKVNLPLCISFQARRKGKSEIPNLYRKYLFVFIFAQHPTSPLYTIQNTLLRVYQEQSPESLGRAEKQNGSGCDEEECLSSYTLLIKYNFLYIRISDIFLHFSETTRKNGKIQNNNYYYYIFWLKMN